MNSKGRKTYYLSRDWPFIPILLFVIGGFIWTLFDLFSDRGAVFHPILRFSGLFLSVVGGIIEYLVRLDLKEKSKFPTQSSTALLKVNKDHQLITDRLFRYIRHPLYASLFLQFIGWGIFCSSWYGLLLMGIALLFIIPRIQIEERMLVNEFGDLYKDYQKRTKKLIPFLY